MKYTPEQLIAEMVPMYNEYMSVKVKKDSIENEMELTRALRKMGYTIWTNVNENIYEVTKKIGGN